MDVRNLSKQGGGARVMPHSLVLEGSSPSLFPLRIKSIYPPPNGADIALYCIAEDGKIYFCKRDKHSRLIRMNEWLWTGLAQYLKIATPECAVLLDLSGETLFGSLDIGSTAGPFGVQDFLTTPQPDELGGLGRWMGQYLARLYVFDLLCGNPDRGLTNFLRFPDGSSSRLCAFDFASADMSALSRTTFPVAGSPTISIGRKLRRTHGFELPIALEMVESIEAVPRSVIEGLFKGAPKEWMSIEERKAFCEGWMGRQVKERLNALRSGLKDGSLL